jgi:uncharacterized Zn-binding protein involved in type VI secretion
MKTSSSCSSPGFEEGRRARCGRWLAWSGLLLLAGTEAAGATLVARHANSTLTWEIEGLSAAVFDRVETADVDILHVYRVIYPPPGTPMPMRATFETDYEWAAGRVCMITGTRSQWAREVIQCPDNPDLGSCPPAGIETPVTLRLQDSYDGGSFRDPEVSLIHAGLSDWYTLRIALRPATNVVLETLEMTYPVGESPCVFTEGWVFGAKCVVRVDGVSMDVSGRVEWSGSGSFTPAQGERSSPSFERDGPQTITLGIRLGNLATNVTYTVQTLDPWKEWFAFVGSKAHCPADAHGDPGDPHPTLGPITSGSALVSFRGAAAARVGDVGTHAACSGPNTFIIMEGDPRVLIDGRPAARMGSATRHCGGLGHIVEGPLK